MTSSSCPLLFTISQLNPIQIELCLSQHKAGLEVSDRRNHVERSEQLVFTADTGRGGIFGFPQQPSFCNGSLQRASFELPPPIASHIEVACLGQINLSKFGGIDITRWPNLAAWHKRCLARPAVNAVATPSQMANPQYEQKLKEDQEARKKEEKLQQIVGDAKARYGYKYSSPYSEPHHFLHSSVFDHLFQPSVIMGEELNGHYMRAGIFCAIFSGLGLLVAMVRVVNHPSNPDEFRIYAGRDGFY
ncbi:hypothetical protein B0A49_11074 [Cryomyces minteri]|uniref:Uncharacterized protein n=1 Tax=Cryomyces minteri TaxID=331657 RepID=A0A4U0VR28_9PEZI|nr:hypothetical protein B0A49_11074 [Cryomyces minteri]